MRQLQPRAATGSQPGPDLEWPLLLTLAYADVFDFPLTAPEAHRYLVGRAADLEAVSAVLLSLSRSGRVEAGEGYHVLAGRLDLIQLRRRREAVSVGLWERAQHYGRLLAALPFVRLVAVSGALALNNTEEPGDIDYFLVTEPGRLWLARAISILVVRLAARQGVTLCPNYLVTTRTMVLDDQNLFTAHELTQMVPLAGRRLYERLRRLNSWTADYLPNADGPPRPFPSEPARGPLVDLAEAALRARSFGWLERWEMERKVQKFRNLERERSGSARERQETIFSADCCKGHLDHHGERALRAFEKRVLSLKEGSA